MYKAYLAMLCFLIFWVNLRAQRAAQKDFADTIWSCKPVDVRSGMDSVVFTHYLDTSLMKAIDSSINVGLRPGEYSVDLLLMTDREGNTSVARVLNGPGFGLELAL